MRGSRTAALSLAAWFTASFTAPARAQESGDSPDPCAHAVTAEEDATCWAREAEAADSALRQAVESLRRALPDDAADKLAKAQKLWLEFREAQIAISFTANPKARPGDRIACMMLSRWQLTRARIREIERMRDGLERDTCLL